jgi:hypothetical protein
MASNRAQLGGILVQRGVITEEQLVRALQYHRDRACRLGEALITLGLCSDVQIAQALSDQIGMPFVDLEAAPPTRDVLRIIPRKQAIEYGVVPVRLEDDQLVVVARNPFDYTMDPLLRKMTGMPVTIACAVDSQICEILRQYDQLLSWERPKNTPCASPVASRRLESRFREQRSVAELMEASEAPAVAQAVEALFTDAVRRGATDVHLVPDREELAIRCRVDGELSRAGTVPSNVAQPVLARLKNLCGMDVSVRQEPQAGFFLPTLTAPRSFCGEIRWRPWTGRASCSRSACATSPRARSIPSASRRKRTAESSRYWTARTASSL